MGITVYESERGQPGLVVHRFRVDPVPRAGPRIQPAGKDIVADLVRGAALETMVLWCPQAAGRSFGLPDGVAAGGRGGCGVKGGRGSRRGCDASATARPEGRPHAARRATAPLLPVAECAWV